MTSKKLKQSYATIFYWRNGLNEAGWREISSLELNDADLERRRLIESKLFEIDRIIKEIYGPRIGEAEMYDIRNKEARSER